MIAHQYIIRKNKSKEEKLEFDHNKLDLSNTSIRLIAKSLAKKIIVEYEWLKSMPLITRYCLGIYFRIDNDEHLGGVLVLSDDYADNTGVWEKYGFDDKIILLSRGVCLWWTPKNTASYFISKAYKWLKNNTKYRIITATVDPAAGEIGTIYQSLNWYYVGLMSGNYNDNKETKRFSVLIDGKLRYSRSIRKEFGTMKKGVILQKYPNAKFISQYRKRRYFYFFDSKSNNKKYYNNIKHIIHPYPKRDQPPIIGFIYKITNLINNKTYIGQTTRPFKDRIKDYKRGICNSYLLSAFNKYGFANFEFKIIDRASTINELNNKEIYWINYYDSTNKNIGYNIELGGNNSIPTNDTLIKMSKSHIGIKQTHNWINKRIAKSGSDDAKKYGKQKTEEEKRLLSKNSPKFWLGKQRDNQTKERIRKTKLEKGFSDKQKEIICKKVIAFNPINNDIINKFDSTIEAAKFYSLSQSTISRRCSGKYSNSGNIFFKYEKPTKANKSHSK